eukprot:365165_1
MPQHSTKRRNNKRRNSKHDKQRRHAARFRDSNNAKRARDLTLKEKDQHYAIVLNALGNNRLEVFCMDVKLRIAYIRKTIARQKRTMWIKPNDLILISMRDFDSYKCDVIHK